MHKKLGERAIVGFLAFLLLPLTLTHALICRETVTPRSGRVDILYWDEIIDAGLTDYLVQTYMYGLVLDARERNPDLFHVDGLTQETLLFNQIWEEVAALPPAIRKPLMCSWLPRVAEFLRQLKMVDPSNEKAQYGSVMALNWLNIHGRQNQKTNEIYHPEYPSYYQWYQVGRFLPQARLQLESDIKSLPIDDQDKEELLKRAYATAKTRWANTPSREELLKKLQEEKERWKKAYLEKLKEQQKK